jgi:predicted GNAT family acetyltransferase
MLQQAAALRPEQAPARSGGAEGSIVVQRNPGVMAEMDVRVIDNPEEQRYELWLGATRAGFIQYRSEPGTIVLVHTEVDPAFEGQGLGARLVAGALDDLRARGLTLVAVCPFVRAYLRHHREYADLVGRGPAGSA